MRSTCRIWTSTRSGGVVSFEHDELELELATLALFAELGWATANALGETFPEWDAGSGSIRARWCCGTARAGGGPAEP